ncbi:class I SAM-dependent methyltransferase [Streptomyces sp. NPDC059506]|uniref:class I SAM-dependent methyltransferase n=1 Tax=Streptomyces sp. NPDC059506 TaxID=3347751 RepID=UPI0036AAD928
MSAPGPEGPVGTGTDGTGADGDPRPRAGGGEGAVDVDSREWDERYASRELVWGAEPNRWLVREVEDLAPGRALDLAAGEGRNALWLADRGWRVTAVDFSRTALDRGRRLAARRAGGAPGARPAGGRRRAGPARPVGGPDPGRSPADANAVGTRLGRAGPLSGKGPAPRRRLLALCTHGTHGTLEA